MSSSNSQTSRKRATYDAIAERAQVSRTTVSLVLRGLARDRIPESTYERVLTASRELGYYANRLVQSMQTGRTETIAVIAPGMWMEHAGRIMEGIRAASAQRGYSILLGSSSDNAESERSSAERLLELRADGLIRFSSVPDAGNLPDWMAEAVSSGIPGVVVDDVALEGKVDCVVSDDVSGARSAVDYLIDQGHRRIAHFRGDLGRTSAEERCQGYVDAIRERHLEYQRVVGNSYQGVGLPEILEALFEEDEPPTALFCCVDAAAIEAQKWLRSHDKMSVAVVGYSGTLAARAAGIPTVIQPFEEMGKRSVELLLDRIADPSRPCRVERLPTTFLVP